MVQVLIIDQYEVTCGCPVAFLYLIDPTGDTREYERREFDPDFYNPYPDECRDRHMERLESLKSKYGGIRPLYSALGDGWAPFHQEPIQVHRNWFTGKAIDGPEFAYKGTRWWLTRTSEFSSPG